MERVDVGVIKQHLIDPEICIRCNTCEATCPVGAITHDARNYVVDALKCNQCMACVPPCPTGSIDNWRLVPRAEAYALEAQFGWDALPAELSQEALAAAGVNAAGQDGGLRAAGLVRGRGRRRANSGSPTARRSFRRGRPRILTSISMGPARPRRPSPLRSSATPG